MNFTLKTFSLGLAASIAPTLVLAQDTAPTEVSYILTTLLFLIGGFLVFFMACGFAMLEAGLVRSKNVTMQLTKNMGLFGLACIFYYLVGFNLMYPGDAWIIPNLLGGFTPTVLEPVGLAAADADLS